MIISPREGIPFNQFLKVLGLISKAFAQAFFDGNKPLLKASRANFIRSSFERGFILNQNQLKLMKSFKIEGWLKIEDREVESFHGVVATWPSRCPGHLGVRLR